MIDEMGMEWGYPGLGKRSFLFFLFDDCIAFHYIYSPVGLASAVSGAF